MSPSTVPADAIAPGTAVRWYRNFDHPNPLLKQAPTVAALLLALAIIRFVPRLTPTQPTFVITAASVIAAATVLAALLSARGQLHGFLVLLIPMLDIVGFGLFRAGTGAGQSLFATLILIPVVWLATAPGPRYVAVVFALTSGMVFVPYLMHPPENPTELLRGVIAPLVYATVAGVINELSRQQRIRVEQAEQLVAERTAALHTNESMIAQLRESEHRYRTVLESFESLWAAITAQAVIATDRSGMITAWNPGAERIIGLTEEEALNRVRVDSFFAPSVLEALANTTDQQRGGAGSPDTAVVSRAGSEPREPGDLPAGIQELFARASAGLTTDEDLEIMTAGGATIPARLTVTRRNDGAGQQQGYLLVVTDETRAAEVARMKDQFVGMISHELRTPLSAIIGFIDLLRNDPQQPLTDDQRDFVDIIERNAKRLLALVGDLLFTAQVESGRFPVELHHHNMCETVRVAIHSAMPHAAEQGVTLTVSLPEHPISVQIDGGRIGQALDNLISNAIKFTPRGGRVEATVTETADTVVVSVRDTGIGIPQDEQGRLFDRFFRASTATANAVPGVGLGLNITHAIVVAHGGSMTVASEEGVGTSFDMTLPLTPRTQALPTVSGAA